MRNSLRNNRMSATCDAIYSSFFRCNAHRRLPEKDRYSRRDDLPRFNPFHGHGMVVGKIDIGTTYFRGKNQYVRWLVNHLRERSRQPDRFLTHPAHLLLGTSFRWPGFTTRPSGIALQRVDGLDGRYSDCVSGEQGISYSLALRYSGVAHLSSQRHNMCLCPLDGKTHCSDSILSGRRIPSRQR